MNNEEAQALGARCGECPLKGNPIVPPVPALGRLRLVVVSDSPGRHDENVGKPLTGAGGKMLWIELGRRGIKERNCHVTHASLCHGDSDKENERAAECCAPRLLGELGALDGGRVGKVRTADVAEDTPGGGETGSALGVPLLLLGKSPAKSVLGVRKVGVARGFLWRIPESRLPKVPKKRGPTPKEALRIATATARNELLGAIAFPTLALSFILKADTWAPIFRRDLDRAAAVALGKSPEEMREEGGPPDGIGGLEVLSRMGAEVACDIETDGIDPRTCGILCIGFSALHPRRRVAVVWPWRDSYAEQLAEWLGRRKRIVFHNGFNFDLLVMRAHGMVW